MTEGQEPFEVAAVLRENGERNPRGSVVAPRVLTDSLWRAAKAAKLHTTNLTLTDWLDTATREDYEAVGIPWPDSPWDRSFEMSDMFQELLIRTLWNAIIAQLEQESPVVRIDKVDCNVHVTAKIKTDQYAGVEVMIFRGVTTLRQGDSDINFLTSETKEFCKALLNLTEISKMTPELPPVEGE